MANINFVPDDYIENTESRRTNLMYLVLLAVVMAAMGGSFLTIRYRQRALDTQELLINKKLARAAEAITQFEQLQAKRKDMMKTALTTAELLEPVPRSVLLAALTNNLPAGVSLLQLALVQKEPPRTTSRVATTKYQQSQGSAAGGQEAVSKEKLLQTNIDIEGVAPSDRQVAAYIGSLRSSMLLMDVALVESKEQKVEDSVFRRFKLKAKLRKDVRLSKQDIEEIRTRGENMMGIF
jgi:Tfp pilus assembly protein PilN